MADKEIGDLTTAAALDGTETLHLVQSGNSRKVTSQLLALLAMVNGQCQLVLDSGSLKLNRHNGFYLWCNGKPCIVPATPLSLAATSLTPATLYYIYASESGGTLDALVASATAPTTHTDGTQVRTGTTAQALVGMAYCVTGPAWADSASQRLVASWFNRRKRVAFKQHGAARSTTSSTLVELSSADRVEFVSWAGEILAGYTGSGGSDTVSRSLLTGVGIDGTAPTAFYVETYISAGVNQTQNVSHNYPVAVLGGYHYASPFGARVIDGTRTWSSAGGAYVALEI